MLMKFKKWFVMAALVLAAGCGTTDAPRSVVEVDLLPDGRFKVGEKTVVLDKLPGQLKSAGAKAATMILISEPMGVTAAQRVQIGTKLASANFRRYTFKPPREVIVTVAGTSTTTTSTTRKSSNTSSKKKTK